MPQADYTLREVASRAVQARQQNTAALASLLELYTKRSNERLERDVPVIAFCGKERAGKDLGAKYFCARTGLTYPGSVSFQVLPFIARSLGVSEEEAWNERQAHRVFWLQWMAAFIGQDLDLLAKMALAKGDVVVGMRGSLELATCLGNKVVNLAIWVSRPLPTLSNSPGLDKPDVDDVKVDQIEKNDCHMGLPNEGSRMEYFAKLDKLVWLIQNEFLTK